MAAPGYTFNNLMGGTPTAIGTAMTATGSQCLRLKTPASSSKRFYVWELDFGQSGPPNATDCSVQWVLEQCDATTAGTWTAPVAQPTSGYVTASNLDLSVTIAQVNATVVSANLLQAAIFYGKAINQRGAGFWQAAPGGELYFPILASTGPIFGAYSATYASTIVGRANYSEI